jgi:hypothetical protein
VGGKIAIIATNFDFANGLANSVQGLRLGRLGQTTTLNFELETLNHYAAKHGIIPRIDYIG